MYFDPGFGSMIIQMIIGLFAAGGVALFAFRQKISTLFGKGKQKNEEDVGTVLDEIGTTPDDE